MIPDKQQPDQQPSVEDVARFWSANPCGSDTSTAADRIAYFQQIENNRYHHEPHIPRIAQFDKFAGKKVLEVGCGVGTDGRQFARHGADYTGINVDTGSTELAREAFRLFNLPGTIHQMNGENLSFADSTFDHVYSFGVIHHSPDTEAMLRQMYRVLKPGGTITFMVYHRNSINYRFEIMMLRKLMRLMLVPKGAPAVTSRVLGLNQQKLERHREIMLGEKMTPERWLSINTDGPDCPLAKVYSRAQGHQLAADAGFVDISSTVEFFDARHYGKLAKILPGSLVTKVGKRVGWHLIVNGRKPDLPK